MGTSFPFVQAASATNTSTVSFPNAVAYGDLIVAVYCAIDISMVPTVTDSLGNFYYLFSVSPNCFRTGGVSLIYVAQGSPSVPFGGVIGGTCQVTFSGAGHGGSGASLMVCEYGAPYLYQVTAVGSGIEGILNPCMTSGTSSISFRAMANNGDPGGTHCSDTGNGDQGYTLPNGILQISLTPQDSGSGDNNTTGVMLMNQFIDVLVINANYNTMGSPISPYWTSSGSIRATTLEPGGTVQAAVADQSFPYLNGPLLAECGKFPTGCLALPYGLEGAGQAPVVSGGSPPYTFTITDGALPNGLGIDPTTGLISGIASVAGLFQFEITITDTAMGMVVITCSIVICPCGGAAVGGGGSYITSK
jgi:hypothetical protein